MGSRLRENPDHLFEVFAEVARPGQPQDAAFVLQKYPDEFNDQKALESEVPKFAFPGSTESNAVDHFSFTLTDEESKLRFGFCRHAAGSQTCLCIVSFLPWFEIYYRLLNHLAEILNRSEANSVVPVLDELYKLPVPKPGQKVDLKGGDSLETFSFECPDLSELPCIPQNRNLTEYYNAVDPATMIGTFASMLQERRIIVTSRKLSRLTSCVHGAASLLYPMHWQHIYIPVLPPHLIDYCSAPMPYLIGVHSTLFQKLKSNEVGDAVIVDADSSALTSDFNDLDAIPLEVLHSLKKKLKAQSSEKLSVSPLGDGVARAFMCANVALIGGYRQALRFPPGERITFDEDAFIHSRPSSMQGFLQKVLTTQIFEQFINEKLDRLIAGEGFSDIFDREVNLEQDKWATQSRYKEWYGNVKKHGKKFRRDGREKWVEISSKVRDKSKRAVKDIRSRIEDLKKPPRPPPIDHSTVLGPSPSASPDGRKTVARNLSFERARQYRVITEEDMERDLAPAHRRPRSPTSPSYRSSASLLRHSRARSRPMDDSDIMTDMTYQRVSLDLLGDQDIQSMLKKSYSLENLTLEDVDGSDASDEWDDVTEEDSQIDYSTLESPATTTTDPEQQSHNNKSPAHPGENGRVPDHLIDLGNDTETIITRRQDINANPISSLQGPTPQSSNSPVSLRQKQNMQQPFNSTQDQISPHTAEQSTPVAPKRSRRKVVPPVSKDKGPEAPPGVTLRQKPSGNQNGSQGGQNDRVTLAFADNFTVGSEPPPPVPPKVPLRPSSGVWSSPSPPNVPARPVTECPEALTGSPGGQAPKRRTSINRKPAFYNEQRPQSFRRTSVGGVGVGPPRATDAQTIKDARSAFIKSDTQTPVVLSHSNNNNNASNKLRSDLDQFDPLLTGQLAVDQPTEGGATGAPGAPGGQEEDLLKEWNLNFDSHTPGRAPPPVPQKPSPSVMMYGSSPSLDYTAYPGSSAAVSRFPYTALNASPVHRGLSYPSSPRLSWSPGSTQLQTQAQSVKQLIQQFSPRHATSPAPISPRPGSEVVMRAKPANSPPTLDRPVSMYVGPQDPFTSVLSSHRQGMHITANGAQMGSSAGQGLSGSAAALTQSPARSWQKFDS